jgi:hypothetical protein
VARRVPDRDTDDFAVNLGELGGLMAEMDTAQQADEQLRERSSSQRLVGDHPFVDRIVVERSRENARRRDDVGTLGDADGGERGTSVVHGRIFARAVAFSAAGTEPGPGVGVLVRLSRERLPRPGTPHACLRPK